MSRTDLDVISYMFGLASGIVIGFIITLLV